MEEKKFKDKTPLEITIIYAVIGGAWILFSDQFLKMLGFDQEMLTWVQTEKGWAYVVVTSLLLYGMINRSVQSLMDSEKRLYESYSQLETVHEELGATHEELVATEEELRQQFDELQERETYYRGVYEGVSSGILVLNQEGQLVHANNSARRLLELESGPKFRVDGIELSWDELVQKCLHTLDSERNCLVEVIQKSGHKLWLLVNYDPLENLETGEEEMVLTLVDHTEEKDQRLKRQFLMTLTKWSFQRFLLRRLLNHSVWNWSKNWTLVTFGWVLKRRMGELTS